VVFNAESESLNNNTSSLSTSESQVHQSTDQPAVLQPAVLTTGQLTTADTTLLLYEDLSNVQSHNTVTASQTLTDDPATRRHSSCVNKTPGGDSDDHTDQPANTNTNTVRWSAAGHSLTGQTVTAVQRTPPVPAKRTARPQYDYVKVKVNDKVKDESKDSSTVTAADPPSKRESQPGLTMPASSSSSSRSVAGAKCAGAAVYVAEWSCVADADNELSFDKGDRLLVISHQYQQLGWLVAHRLDTGAGAGGRVGLVPTNYVTSTTPDT